MKITSQSLLNNPMKRKNIILMLSFIFCQLAYTQATEGEGKLREQVSDTSEGWRMGGIVAVNISQTSLTHWAGGGQNSVALGGLFSKFANYKKGKNTWDNSLDIGFGLLQQGKGSSYMKTDDKIDLLTKYGRQFSKSWYFAALFNFKTQLAPGYNYPNDTTKISDFFAPAYALTAVGFDFKPDNYLSAFVAPVTSKITIVNDQSLADAGAFGVDKASYDDTGLLLSHGKKQRNEFGGYLRIIYSRNNFKPELLKNISFTTKLDLFSNYLHNPENIDVNWESLIAMNVNKYITVNLTTHLVYDNDIIIVDDKNADGIIDINGPRIQFKEILGVGFLFKW